MLESVDSASDYSDTAVACSMADTFIPLWFPFVLQFCCTLHKEVAHETLLHKDRKQLHRVAALICDQEAEMWPMEERLSVEFFEIQKELARQWLCAVHDTELARQSLAQFSDDTWQADLKLAAFAIEELLDLACKRGIGKLKNPETYMVSDESFVFVNSRPWLLCCNDSRQDSYATWCL